MNLRALKRLDRRQLLDLEFLALQFRAWVEVAHLLQRIGLPSAYALQRARLLESKIDQVLA